MALPDSFSGVLYAPNGGRHGPFENSGDYYIVVRDSITQNIEVWKSTNPGTASWSVATSETGWQGTMYSLDVIKDGTNLHIFRGGVTGGGDVYYEYAVFSMSSDTFTTGNETAISITANQPSSIDVYGAIAVRSDGSIVALIQDAQPKVMGINEKRVSYLKRSSAGTWDSSTTAVDDGGSVSYSRPRAVLGASNKVHFAYYDGTTDLYHKSLNSSDTLSSAEKINDNGTAVVEPRHYLEYVSDGTNELVLSLYPRTVASNNVLYSVLITNDGTPSAEVALDNSVATGGSAYRFALAVDNNSDSTSRFYALLIDTTDQDIYLETYTPSSGWSGSFTAIETSITATLVLSGNVYTNDSSDTVLAYLYDESTNGESYNEYVLSSGSTTHNLTGTSESTFETTADLDAQQNLGGTTQADVETTANLDAQQNLTGPTQADSETSADLFTLTSLTGTSESTFEADADLSLQQNLAGESQSDFDSSADLDAQQNLDGTSQATFETSADLSTTSGTTHELTGTAEATFESDADLSAQQNLVGTAQSDFESTSDLSLQQNLSGIGQGDFESSADLASQQNLAGEAHADFETTGDLSAQQNLTSDIEATLETSADLSTILSLTGASEADSEASADLSLQQNLSGDAQSTTETSGNLSSQQNLAGTSQAEFETQAGLSLQQNLAYESQSTFETTASLSISGEVSLTGTSETTFESNADLDAQQNLSGEAEGLFGTNADLSITQSLSGDAEGIGETTATLSITDNLDGESVSVFESSADLSTTDTTTLTGSSDVTFESSADLTAITSLSGATEAVFESSAELTTVLSLSGSSQGEFESSAELSLQQNLNGVAQAVFETLATLSSHDFRTDYDGTLSLYQSYRGELDSYEPYAGQLWHYQLYKSEADIYQRYDAEAGHYQVYKATLYLEGDMKTIVLGGGFYPMLQVSKGKHHGGVYAAPDEVKFEIYWDGTNPRTDPADDTYTLTGNPTIVQLDSVTQGLYFAELTADVEGTVWVVAWAEWSGKEYDTRRQQRFEIIAKGEEAK